MKKIIPLMPLMGLILFIAPLSVGAQCASGETLFSYCYGDFLTNEVAFEVCPSAGMAAQAEITQGTFDAFFGGLVGLSVYEGASGSGTAGMLLFGPANGDVSGNTITATTANNCLVFVVNSAPFGTFSSCQDGFQSELQVCGSDVAAAMVSFTAPADLCLDAGLQTGLGGGMPTGGVYSGDGVIDGNNGMTYSFNPALAGTGVTTITYTNGASASDDIEVFAAPSFTALGDLCIDAGIQTGLGGGSPSGGIYSGPGVTDDGNGSTYSFNPGAAGLGISTITYTTEQGCSTSDDVEVLAACGCTGGLTNYFYCYDNFELNTVAFEVCPTAGMAAQATIFSGAFEEIPGPQPDDNLTVYEGVSGSSTSGTLIFGPSTGDLSLETISGTVADNCLIFVINSDGAISCADDITGGTVEGLAVCGESIAAGTGVTFITTVQNVCLDGGTVTIGGGIPSGGMYSGTGVVDDGNGMTFTFDPATAGAGLETVTYTNGGSATDDINVIDLSVDMADPGQIFLPTDGDQFLSSLGTPSGIGGAYSGMGVTDLGDGVNFLFNPMTVGEGSFPVTYSFTDANGCSGSDAFTFVVAEPMVTFTALDDLSIGAGVQTGLSGGFPTGGVYSGPGVTDDGNGMTYTFDPANAGLGVWTLTYTLGGNSASDDVEVLNIMPPNFSKSFSPTQISVGSASVLTFTIDNNISGVPAEELTFVDNLPAGMTVAAIPNVQSSCTGGTVTAMAGSSTISYSDGAIGGSSSCTISVNVEGTTAGTLTNTTGDLTSTSGNSGPASADLQVFSGANRPLFSKSFDPVEVNIGERSTLTFTIDNSQGGGNIFNITFSDMLPIGMVIATPANATIDFTGALNADSGSDVISVFSGILTPGQVGTITVDVEATAPGELINITDELISSSGNSGLAIAKLDVNAEAALNLQATFDPAQGTIGETANLEFTISNNNRDFAATDVTFTLDLDAALSGLAAVGTPLNDECGLGSQLSGTSLLTFSAGAIPAEGSCTFSIPVLIPASATAQTVTAMTSAISGTVNGSTITGNTSTAQLFIANYPTVTKTFLTDPTLAGETVQLEFEITNNSSASALTDVTFEDNIAAFLSGATVVSSTGSNICGSGSFVTTTLNNGQLTLLVIGANVPASGSCSFIVDIAIDPNTPAGTYTNTTSAISGEVDGFAFEAPPVSDDLTVLSIPRLSKSFTNDPVSPGGTVDLEFTITYDENATVDATGISFTDDLSGVLAGLVATGLPLNNICGTGSSLTGTTSLSFAGGTLTPGGSCTFTVTLDVPAGALPGSYTNTTSDVSSTVAGQAATGAPATDDLQVGGINFTKEFLDNPVLPGQTTTLRFNIENEITEDATITFFTDNLGGVGGVLNGLAATGPPTVNTCGGTLSGTTNLFYIGGAVPAQSNCVIEVEVLVPANAMDGTYSNVTSNLSVSVMGQPVTVPPATANLVVDTERLSLTKSFIDDPAAPGGTTTVEYTLTNLDGDNAISNIFFSDDFASALAGLAATGLPAAECGGTVSGTGVLSFSGGSLAAGASCTFTVTLSVPAAAPQGAVIPISTSEVTYDIDGIPLTADPASDDLIIQGLTFDKTIVGPAEEGGTTTITFDLTNNSDQAISDIEFTDDLDAFISGMTVVSLPPNTASCGVASGVSGTSVLSFGRGALAPGASCSFTVEVLVPCGTMPGMYTNTTSEAQYNTASFTTTTDPATAMLTVDPAPSSGSFTAPADLCVDAGVQLGLGGGMPAGGMYSGAGVTNNGDGTYDFDPEMAAIGLNTITYSVLDDNGCSLIDYTDDVEVFDLPNVTVSLVGTACENDPILMGIGGGTPNGGVYSGTGVMDGGNGLSYNFDPSVGPGVYQVTYTYTDPVTGCTNSATSSGSGLTIFGVPEVTFTAPDDICFDQGVLENLGGGMPMGGTYMGDGVTNNMDGTYNFDPAMSGTGTITISYSITTGDGCTAVASDDIEVFAFTDPPVPNKLTASLCVGQSSGTVRVVNPEPGTEIFWNVLEAPVGASFMTGDDLAPNVLAPDYRTDLDANGRRLRLRGNNNVVPGTYRFKAFSVNADGCPSSLTDEEFVIEAFAAPEISIIADPDGDLCLNTIGVQYSVDITPDNGDTYSYVWCAYNSGDGSGTCFDGFDDNTSATPTRSWTSTSGMKSVGVTVTNETTGCEVDALYSFNVVAPTMVACPADLTATLETDDMTFDCLATATFDNPSVAPGPCDPVTLTISVDGGAPETVTPGDPYTATFDELGDYDVTYTLVDDIGNTSTCSFTITVDGLPCGFADNGGINCSGSNSDYDLGSEIFTVNAGDCVPEFPFTGDATAFVFTELCGDGEIIAKVEGIAGGQGFAGVMVRDSEAPGAPMMAIGTNTINRVRKEVRVVPNYPAFPQAVVAYDQIWVRITRTGPSFRGFASPDGVNWFPYLFQNIQMGPCIKVGLYAYNEKPESPITATFSNVFVTGVTDAVDGGSTTTFLNGTSFGENATLSIYPNPTNGELNLNLSDFMGERADIRVFNSMGQQVMTHRIDQIEIPVERMDMSQLKAGMYHVSVKVGEMMITERVVIAR